MIFYRRLSLLTIFVVNLLSLTSIISGQEIHNSYISINPDGTLIAVANNSTIKIYDIDTLQLMNSFTNLEHQVTEPTWSPDGRYLAFGNASNIEIWQDAWNPNMAQLDGVLQTDWYVRTLAWSPNGNMLAVGNDALEVWDISTAERLYVKYEHNLFLTNVVWSPDNTQLVTSSLDNTVKIWEAFEGSVLSTITLETNRSAMPIADWYQSALSLSWQPDGNKLIMGVSDGTVRIWDTSTLVDTNITSYWGDSNVISVHDDAIHTVIWNVDGRQIASVTQDRLIFINGSTYRMSEPIYLDTSIYSIAWALNCESLFYADGRGIVQILNFN